MKDANLENFNDACPVNPFIIYKVERCQKMSKDVKICQKTSKYVKRRQNMSKDVKRCQKMSKDVKRCQKMSKDVNRCQKMSKDVKRCQKMSKDVNRCQKMSKDVKSTIYLGTEMMFFPFPQAWSRASDRQTDAWPQWMEWPIFRTPLPTAGTTKIAMTRNMRSTRRNGGGLRMWHYKRIDGTNNE